MTRAAPGNALVFRIVAVAWLFGWFLKIRYFAFRLLDESFAYPLDAESFSPLVQSPIVAAVAWCVPACVVGAVLFPRLELMRAASVGMALCAFVLCAHLETFNDATFVTSFWVALWLVWFSFQAQRSDRAFVTHARALGLCVVALMFLGAAMGKLTSEYTSGEAFYELYFAHRQSYAWLRDDMSPDELRHLALWFSRLAIAVELAMAALPLMPLRVAIIFGCAVMLGTVAVSTVMLLSVMSCLVGLLIALWFVPDPDESHPR